MSDKRVYLLKEAPVNRAVKSMALPSIIGLVVTAIYNIVDTMFIAWLGRDQTAATQVVLPIVMLTTTIGLAIGIGGGGYISRLLGANRIKDANEVGSVSIFISMLLGLVSTLLLLASLESILLLLGANGRVLIKSQEYGFYIVLGTLFSISNMTMNNILRSDGSAKISMIALGIGTILNIILDPVFIFLFGIGIKGAAIATTISQGVTFILLLIQFLNNKSLVRVKLHFIKPSRDMFREISKIGIPTFIKQLLFSISIGFLNQAATTYGGSDLLAAIGIIFRIGILPMYIITGLSYGFQPVVGYSFGAKNRQRVKSSLKYTYIAGLKLSVICGAILIIFASPLLSIFKPSKSVMELGLSGVIYLALTVVLMSVNSTTSVFFQAIGRGRESIVLAAARQGFLFIPLCFILPILLGTKGVFMILLGADLLTVIISISLIIVYFQRYMKLEF